MERAASTARSAWPALARASPIFCRASARRGVRHGAGRLQGLLQCPAGLLSLARPLATRLGDPEQGTGPVQTMSLMERATARAGSAWPARASAWAISRRTQFCPKASGMGVGGLQELLHAWPACSS